MILEEIAEKTRERIQKRRQQVSEEELKEKAYLLAGTEKERNGGIFPFPFEKALAREGISFICEVKKASPSKGVIAEEFPYREIAREYEQAGASALSVLTEPFYFQGSDDYLKEIERVVNIPILRKDFTVDAYMLYEAKCIGASAVLLICAILDDRQLMTYMEIAQELGLSALVEAHTEEEVRRALACGARIIGVNNRDLKTFQVDIHTSERLRRLVPKDVLYVSESGIKSPEDVRRLKENGTDAVLIGETLMRSDNKKKMLGEFRG
ncbi:indole-3-glycerol phosphate synthase TrpC [Clostridium sp. AF19-22AC]|jgi:indole-3-glycerol phosphate synthase|uniref:indole-3-glycerol phosphate synthase TrpC n=1 Tax=Clostridia TaxID=186801 RepID=UPI000E48ED43|nr:MULTISPECIES: indole-3-glycerol phosphate synthase TrpC [Clostridia]RHR32640.1 indole-3-glycerol phosphate synthase TrpC [Clostridium sp. AF19-22AC]